MIQSCYASIIVLWYKILQSNIIHTGIIHKLGIWLWNFFWGVGQLARFRMLTKVIKASIFCFLASVQGYSSSKVDLSSVLKQADLWPKSAQSCHLPLRYSNSVANHLTDLCICVTLNVTDYKPSLEFYPCVSFITITSQYKVTMNKYIGTHLGD